MAFVLIVVGDTCNGVVYGFTIALAQQMAAVWAGVVDDGLVLLCAPHGVFLPCAQGEEVGVCGGNAVCVGFVPEFIHVFIVCRSDGTKPAALVLATKGIGNGCVYFVVFIVHYRHRLVHFDFDYSESAHA